MVLRGLPERSVDAPALQLESDEDLLRRCKTQDAGALGQLFDRHHASVYRFLSRLAGTDMREFDDLVQATFLEVPKAARGFRGGASVKTWLFAIAANVARHHTRSALRRKRLLVGVAEPNAAGAPAVVAPPDELAERRQLLTQVGQALEALPHDLRVAFVGCVIEELPCAEVAGALGVPEGTLWRRVHEARTWIRASLESQR